MLKESETVGVGRSFLLSPEAGHKPYVRVPLLTQRKGASLSLKPEGPAEESETTGLATFPPVYYLWLMTLFPYHIFP